MAVAGAAMETDTVNLGEEDDSGLDDSPEALRLGGWTEVHHWCTCTCGSRYRVTE